MNSILQNQKPVEFFSAERIKIEIDGQQILWRDMTLKIDSRIGEHTVGKIKYIASLQQINIYDAAIDKDEDIKIIISGRSNISNENGTSNDKIFLNGIIDDIKLSEIKTGSLVVEITCISKSIILDRIPRYRSFQDPSLTYSAIAEEINKNYGANGEKIISVGEDMKEVPRMTIQYNETDWEYLKRLASYTGQPIIPYYDKVLVGFLKNQAVQTPNTTYSQYGKSKKNKRTMYKITGTEVYAVSTPIKLKTRNRAGGEETENDYYVIESRIYNEGNTLKCEYTLGKQTDYFVDPIPHEKIKGAVIEARTVHIARTDESKSNHGRSEGSSDNLEGKTIGAKPLNKYIEKAENQSENVKERVKASDIAVMTLNLTEGLLKLGENGQSFEDKYAGKSYFPYVTPYSQTNTGFTPAPEVNDRVALYFPNGNETHAIVLGAVNNDGNGRFTNPDKRNFTLGNSQGGANNGKPMYDFTLDSEKFTMSTGNVISMESSGTINVAGRSNVGVISTTSNVNVIGSKSVNSVVGSSKVTIDPNNINVNGNSSVDIKGGAKLSATGGQVSIGAGAGTTDIKGGKVKVH
ncbi:phage baseplate assembly protein V [Leptotrichia massiliensis]|uniref:phage baseplate assembly protein V n=1 Tax=Leptotrichia massiliensis TaxID=1852388 RepID=UPI0008DAABF6|nr:phage baseplate assembly protein V [Leptotrichia massiliensis]